MSGMSKKYNNVCLDQRCTEIGEFSSGIIKVFYILLGTDYNDK